MTGLRQENNTVKKASHTKIFALLIICIAIIASIWLLNRSVGVNNLAAHAANTLSDSSTVSSVPRDPVSSVDSDGDGLPDWQEVLIGTDPHNPDTDGDGTPDGAEIAQGRDPRVKGPNDKNPNISTIVSNLNSQTSSANSIEGTLTDQMSKDFFAQYLQLKQGGKQVTAEQAAQIAQNTLTSQTYAKTTGVVYTVNDLHMNSKTSLQISQKYSDDLLQIVKNRTVQQTEDVMTILGAAVKKQNPGELKKIDPFIVTYKGIISDLLAITVPSDAAGIHLALLNAVSNVLDNVEAMRVTFTDPVRAFAAVSQYKQHMTDMGLAVKKINDYFVSKNIVHQTIK